MKALTTTLMLAAALAVTPAIAQTKAPAKTVKPATPVARPATAKATTTKTAAKPVAKPAAKPVTAVKEVSKPAAAPATTPAPEPTQASAKSTGSGAASGELFRKGTNAVNLGVGLLGVGYGYSVLGGSNYSSTPVMSASFEHGLIEGVGPGTIGVGGLVGYRADTWKYSGYRGTWSNTYVAVRGSYHYNVFQNAKLDTYAGLTLGVRIFSYSDNDDSADDYYSSSTYAHSGIFAGARYFFTNNIGAFGELGYDMSYLKVGLTAKF